MIRSLLSISALVCATLLQAQTYFYIDEIVVDPQPATTQDDINIDIIGGLSSTGAYIVSATADVTGFVVTVSIVAADPGGLTVIVPHTETVNVGQLPAGTYTIVLNMVNVADFSPVEQHTFEVMGAGSACDSVELVSIRWHAFTDTAIVVHVINNSTDIFSYPNFILFDMNGDTLAVEEVNFFGIGGDSYHILRMHDDAIQPLDPFYGLLELWTLFTDSLRCTWLPFIDLCPPEPCATLTPTIQNLGGALAIGTYSWNIFDEDFNSVATGMFTMTDVMQYDSDTICVPPGNYYMAVSMNQPPTGGNPVYHVAIEGFISGPSQQVPWDLPVLMPFSFYLPCDDGTNGVQEMATSGINAQQVGNALHVRRSDGEALGSITLHDSQGRLIASRSAVGSEVVFPLEASGLYIVRSEAVQIKITVVM